MTETGKLTVGWLVVKNDKIVGRVVPSLPKGFRLINSTVSSALDRLEAIGWVQAYRSETSGVILITKQALPTMNPDWVIAKREGNLWNVVEYSLAVETTRSYKGVTENYLNRLLSRNGWREVIRVWNVGPLEQLSIYIPPGNPEIREDAQVRQYKIPLRE